MREWDVYMYRGRKYGFFCHLNSCHMNSFFLLSCILTVEKIQRFIGARISVDEKDWKMRENLNSTHSNLLRGWLAGWLVYVCACLLWMCCRSGFMRSVLCMYVYGIKQQCIHCTICLYSVRYCTIQYNVWSVRIYRPTDRIYWMWMDTVEQNVHQNIEALFLQRHINTYKLTNTLERVTLAHKYTHNRSHTHTPTGSPPQFQFILVEWSESSSEKTAKDVHTHTRTHNQSSRHNT